MDITIHQVAEIRVEANSSVLPDCEPVYWQTFVLIGTDGRDVGRITLFLEDQGAALPVGDQPPYWGIDPSKPLALIDGKAPF